MSSSGTATLSLVAAAAALLPAAAADACGAMLFAQHEERPGGMSDQEILVVDGQAGTTVIVSAGYVDTTGEFAFLLPLREQPTEISDGEPAVFLLLEQDVGPRVQVRNLTVAAADEGGCGCGAASDAGGASRGGGALGNGGVVVHDRGQTATYDYVVLGGGDAAALTTWLQDNGFAAPDAFAQTASAYTDDGWLFLAAKVRAEQAKGALAPIQMRFPAGNGASMTIPLGISAHSLPPNRPLSVTLYTIRNGQALGPANYDTARIENEDLAATGPETSDYDEVFRAKTGAAAQGVFILEGSQDWHTGALESAWERLREWGEVPEGMAGEGISDLVGRLSEDLGVHRDQAEVRLSRYRTELAADKLRDLTLAEQATDEVWPERLVDWSGSTSHASLGLLALGLLVLRGRRLRPRG